ncbi:MAG: hypothetical protein JWR83_3571, partial [Aeromicrobium sp.]|nr:hypothetical protein [Aeromicrobium sp.]
MNSRDEGVATVAVVAELIHGGAARSQEHRVTLAGKRCRGLNDAIHEISVPGVDVHHGDIG